MDPGETVIGFIGCTTETEKRIFIDRSEIPRGPISDGYESCEPDTVKISKEDFDISFKSGFLIPITYAIVKNAIVGVQSSTPECVDCRVKGGTNIKPSFWQ